MVALSIPQMSGDEVRRRDAEAQVLLSSAHDVYKDKLAGVWHFLHEHPAGTRSWSQDQVKELVAHPRGHGGRASVPVRPMGHGGGRHPEAGLEGYEMDE